MASQRKINIVEKLKDKTSRAKALVFVNYQGLTHKQLEGLKKTIKAQDAELVATKNTLLKKALEPTTVDVLEGSTATLFVFSDMVAPLKELYKTIRLLKLPTIKFGIFEGKILTGEEILKLATLPSREILIMQLIGQLKSPIYRLNYSLSFNLQRLVLMLKAIENKLVSSN